MTAVLVDSNVLIDVMALDPVWRDWSRGALSAASQHYRLVINPIIYAEASIYFERIETFEQALAFESFSREDLPYRAAFEAGKAFLAYRRSSGAKTSPLPDFFIGAHATVGGYQLLTRDPARYRTYFPALELIAPD